MKKLKTLLVAGIMAVTTSLMAAPADKHIGVNMVTMDIPNNEAAYGVVLGMDKLFNPIDSVEGFGIGFNFNVNFNQLDSSADSTSDYSYGADAGLLVGYNFKTNGVPINLKAGVGYDFEVLTSDTYYSGVIYTASLGYDFTDKYGVEVRYKTGDMTLETAAGSGPDFTVDTVSAMFVWRY